MTTWKMIEPIKKQKTKQKNTKAKQFKGKKNKAHLFLCTEMKKKEKKITS